MISKNWLLAAGTSTVLAFGVAACGDDDESSSDSGGDAPSGLSGSISLDGSSAGETDISNASRSIEPEEEKLCADGGVEYTEVQVANDGISIVTNPDLEISCLTTDQLAQLWTDDTVTNYSELGEDANTGEPLPDVDVSLYGPGTDSGTFDYFTDVINGEEGVSRKEYQASEDDNVLVQGVSGDTAGLGYFGFSYYEQNAEALNLVSVDGGDGCVEPSAETISDASYAPLARPLFMYPSATALTDKPEVEGFMQYVVDNAADIAEAALIVPMSEEQASEAKSAFEGAIGG